MKKKVFLTKFNYQLDNFKCIQKYCLLLLFLLFNSISGVVIAQDIIITKDKKEIEVNVIEVGLDEVKYTRQNTNAPIYILSKSEINLIIYENGQRDVFENDTKQDDKNSSQLDNTIYRYTFGNRINPNGGRKNAWGSGIASLFIPGLGQFINGDVGGGFLFLGANIIFNSMWMNSSDAYDDGTDLFTLGLLASIGTNVWSVINAANVAKKVNLARGHQHKNSAYLNIEPKNFVIHNENKNNLAYGLSLKLTF